MGKDEHALDLEVRKGGVIAGTDRAAGACAPAVEHEGELGIRNEHLRVVVNGDALGALVVWTLPLRQRVEETDRVGRWPPEVPSDCAKLCVVLRMFWPQAELFGAVAGGDTESFF